MKFKFIRNLMLEADKGDGTNGASGSAGSEGKADNDETSGNKGAKDGDDNDDDSSKKEKSYTQAQVDAMVKKANATNRKSLYESLGFASEDEAEKSMKAFKAYLDSQKSDEEKSAEAIKATNQKLAEATRKAEEAEAKVEAMKLGAKAENVDDLVALALIKKSSSDGDFKTIIGELKTKYASMFATEDDDSKDSKGKKGTGSTIKNSGKKDEEGSKSMGARLAAQRIGSKKKTSFFDM